MPRIAYLSPLPPAATGIAGYSEALLPRLRAHTEDRVDAFMPASIEEGDRELRESHLGVYHIGNNLRFHHEIYALAVRHPGLVVLHDLALDDLVSGLDAAGDPLGAEARAEAHAAARALRATGLEVDGPLATPWCAHLVRRARGVIVHAPFGRRYLEALGTRTPVYVVPHPPISEPRGRRFARAERRVRRKLRGRGPVIGVLGDIGRAKGIEAALAALARIDGGAVLAIVGRHIPGFDVLDEVRRSGRERHAVVEQDVSDAAFSAWLKACDIVLNLRYPHRGEVSGTVVRALQTGVPTIVSAAGTYLDLPGDAVVRVPAGPPDPVALAEALGELLSDPARRRRIGERARAYVEGLAREEASGVGYAAAITATLRIVGDPGRPALTRWAEALADVGGGDRDLRFGARYVEALRALQPPGPPS